MFTRYIAARDRLVELINNGTLNLRARGKEKRDMVFKAIDEQRRRAVIAFEHALERSQALYDCIPVADWHELPENKGQNKCPRREGERVEWKVHPETGENVECVVWSGMKNNMFKSIVEVNRGTAKKETIADSSTALREEDLTLAFRDNTASQLAAARTRRGETKETPQSVALSMTSGDLLGLLDGISKSDASASAKRTTPPRASTSSSSSSGSDDGSDSVLGKSDNEKRQRCKW